MKARGYGKWSAENFSEMLLGLSPAADTSEANIEWDMEDLKERGLYDSFKNAFVQFLLDDSLTFAEKGDLYLDGMASAPQAWDYFKWLWENLAPGEPWPLADRPRPPK